MSNSSSFDVPEVTPAMFFDNPSNHDCFGRCLTKKELAQKLGFSQAYINILMNREGLPHIKIGRSVRYPVGDVVSWLQKRRRP